MKSILRLIVLGLLVGGWGLAGLSLHLVRTEDAFTIVPKNRLAITDTWVDARNWTLQDAATHPEVIQRLRAAGLLDVLKNVANSADPAPLETQLANASRLEAKSPLNFAADPKQASNGPIAYQPEQPPLVSRVLKTASSVRW